MDDDRNYEDSDYYNNLMDGGVSEEYFMQMDRDSQSTQEYNNYLLEN